MHQHQQPGAQPLPEGEAELRRAREQMEMTRDALMVASRVVSGVEGGGGQLHMACGEGG